MGATRLVKTIAACALIIGLTTTARAESIIVMQGGIRKKIDSQLKKDPISSGGVAGVKITTTTFTYVNVRDQLRDVLVRAKLRDRKKTEDRADADVNALIAGVRSGLTSVAALDQLLGGPVGRPGEQVFPAGFHAHDPDIWQNGLHLGSGDFSARARLSAAALGEAFRGTSLDSAKAYVARKIQQKLLEPWQFSDIFNRLEWEFSGPGTTNPQDNFIREAAGIGSGGPVHYAPIVLEGPGAELETVFSNLKNREFYVPGEGGTYVAVAFFLSEAHRWLRAEATLRKLGAVALAAIALDRARDDAGILSYSGNLLALDLDRSRQIEITGRSASIIRSQKNRGFVESGSVLFDLYHTGMAKTEWIRSGDALLGVHERIQAAIAENRNFKGRDLLGNGEGDPGGFVQLALFDRNRDGKISGTELASLCIWQDADQDGQYAPGEIKTLAEEAISEIGTRPKHILNPDREPLDVSYYMRKGKPELLQEVRFERESHEHSPSGR